MMNQLGLWSINYNASSVTPSNFNWLPWVQITSHLYTQMNNKETEVSFNVLIQPCQNWGWQMTFVEPALMG